MTFKEIQDLIKLVNKSELTEVKIKEGEFELSIRTKKYAKSPTSVITTSAPQVMPISTPMQTPMMPAAASPSTTEEAQPAKVEEKSDASSSGKNLLEVKSPIVGTFYRSASPDKPPYVKVGDTIDVGSVVCIVEAMKLFNEIESEVSGKIVKVLVEDASPVEYDQVLYLVEPA